MNERSIFFSEALIEAKIAEAHNEVPIGAVVVCDGRVIGRGHNMKESSHNPTAHAEILAIQNAAQSLGNWRLESCTLVTTLEPCMMCLAATQHARIKKLVYGAKDSKGGAISLGYHFHSDERTNHRFEVEYFEEPECGTLLSAFFSRLRKT